MKPLKPITRQTAKHGRLHMSVLHTKTGRMPLGNLWRAWLAALAVLLATSALSLAFAGSAAAGVGTGTPITLNAAWWSGSAGFGTIAPTAYFDYLGIVHLWGAAKQNNAPCGPHGCVIRTTDPNLLGTGARID